MKLSFRKNKERGVFDVHESGRRSIFGRNTLNLRLKFRNRHPLAWLLGVVVVILTVVLLGHHGFTRGQVKDFFPTSCLGDWQDPSAAAGKPETLTNQHAAFVDSNSAVENGSGTQIFCGGFVPPTFATSGNITSVGLTLVWQIGDGTLPTTTPIGAPSFIPATSTVPTPAPEVIGTTSTATTTSPPADETSTEPPVIKEPPPLSTSPSSSTPPPGTIIVPSETPAPLPSNDAASDTSAFALPSTIFSYVVPIARADEITSTVPAEETTTVVELGPPLEADLTVPTTTKFGDASDTASSTDVASTSLPVVPPPPPDENFLEVSYSTDGENWSPLQRVNVENWPKLTVAVPVTTWEDLQNLQVRIKEIPTLQDPLPKIYVDGMLLEVQYDPSPEELKNEANLNQPHFYIDQTQYQMGDQIAISGAPPASYIEIYSLTDPNNASTSQNDYGIQINNVGETSIDTNTLAPGSYIFVSTLEPGACNEYTIDECRARDDYVAETPITIVPHSDDATATTTDVSQ